jgi:hypothetical protein
VIVAMLSDRRDDRKRSEFFDGLAQRSGERVLALQRSSARHRPGAALMGTQATLDEQKTVLRTPQ